MNLLTNGGVMKYSHKQMVDWQIQCFAMVTELMLALRVVLRFFNANPDATFVHWAYTSTSVLLEPFRNVFTSIGVVQRGWVVDFVALFAMAVYGALAYWLMMFLGKKK